MRKRDMKGALAATLKVEETAVAARVPSFDERLQRADRALGTTPAAITPVTPAPTPAVKKGEGRAVRDAFSMTLKEYDTINDLRKRCAKRGHFANRSVTARAGILALARMSDDELLAAVGAVPSMTPGRSKKQP